MNKIESGYIENFYRHTSKLSLIFRIIVLGWFFVAMIKGFAVPYGLILAIIFDLSQYLYAGNIWNWNCFKINNDKKYRAYFWTNFPTTLFFNLKIILLIVSLIGVFYKCF